jgi:hypothetical protein
MDKFSIYLRTSDAGNHLGGSADLSNTPLRIITKENIFTNFLEIFGTENLHIMADNVKPETVRRLEENGIKDIVVTGIGNNKSFINMIHLALNNATSDEDIVYIVEDDYLHMPDSEKYIREGVTVADYVSLYDSLDKYKDSDKGGYNPFIYGGGEDTKVIITDSIHWKYTNATTGTFATKIKTIKEDYDVIMKWCAPQFSHPMDFSMFRELITQKKRKLINCIPGRSAHVGLEMPPFVDWLSLIKDIK